MQNKNKQQIEQKLPFFRGLCALTIFGLAISSFEVVQKLQSQTGQYKQNMKQICLYRIIRTGTSKYVFDLPQNFSSQIKSTDFIQDFIKRA